MAVILPIPPAARKLRASAKQPGTAYLVPHLDGLPAGPAVGGPHTLGLLDSERQGLLLVDMLTGFQGSDEMLRVKVLRRGDQDRIDGAVVEQMPIVQEGL